MEHLTPLVERIEHIQADTGRCIVLLDGMAAAGKTTAARYLATRFGAPVIHMDDFFLPPELRTEHRLETPGGNVHYERFAREVLPGLLAGESFSYGVFDCGLMALRERKIIPAAPVVIVEGAYAMHPFFGDYGDVTVFLSVTPPEQRRRILADRGPEKWEAFRTRWIPLENAYHTACHTRDRADLVL